MRSTSFAPPIWDAWNARTPERQAADVVVVDRALVDALERIGEDEAATLTFRIGELEFDLAGMEGLRLGEHAVHVWDCAVLVDADATVEPLAVDELVDGLGLLAGYTGKPTGGITRVRISTTDPEREFVLDATEQVSLTPWVRGEPLRRLILPAEALLRLVYGRLDATTPAMSIARAWSSTSCDPFPRLLTIIWRTRAAPQVTRGRVRPTDRGTGRRVGRWELHAGMA